MTPASARAMPRDRVRHAGTVRDRLHAVVRDYYALDDDVDLFAATTLATFNFDDLDVVHLGVDIEEEFALEIPLDMLADATTLGELEDWLTDQLTEKTA